MRGMSQFVNSESPRIAVVGSGAVGCYYGGKLAAMGHDVRFLMRSDLEAVRQNGLTIRSTTAPTVHLPKPAVYGSTTEIGPVDLVIIAVKTTANAALETLIPPLLHESTVLVTLQMLDDWEDWEKDLREGSYNSLISVVQHELQIPSDRRPTPDEVKHALHVRDILFIFAERTDQNAAILEANAPGLTHLHEFHDYLRTNLRQGAESLKDERNLLAQGGLAYWLANQKI